MVPFLYIKPSVVVCPNLLHLLLERLQRKLQRRAREPNLELLQNSRVQDAK